MSEADTRGQGGAPPSARRALPLLGPDAERAPRGGRAERADAAQNRRRILAAAADLIATRGVETLSMDEVARVAGVGVGTVYRRFRDRAGLLYAVLDDRERDFQTAFLQGPPPLGPGADPLDRVRAFLHALADRTEDQMDLLLMAESDSPDARFNDGSYELYRMHLETLIARIRPSADAAYVADALLAPLAANLFRHQRRTRGMSLERVKAGLDDLVAGLTAS
ncbi:TetR/AcrR family transcriptional regulator [Actinomadura miaoliensis]|uniref:TetR/AcrR family transcriptional regulator n=1 Tax=Actinomadura miaoliensis TaxID=430685 RepID=A0ABP7WAS9_9ACTN